MNIDLCLKYWNQVLSNYRHEDIPLPITKSQLKFVKKPKSIGTSFHVYKCQYYDHRSSVNRQRTWLMLFVPEIRKPIMVDLLKNYGTYDHLTFIYTKSTINIHTEVASQPQRPRDQYCEELTYSGLSRWNRFHNIYCPDYKLVFDRKEILNTIGEESCENLPRMSHLNDPVPRFFGFQVGDIVCIKPKTLSGSGVKYSLVC